MNRTTEIADTVLRVAWLREHGHRLFDVDPSGQLSAALWDFADLLERDNGSAAAVEADGSQSR